MFHVLQVMRVPSKLVYFKDENHWVVKPQNTKLWHDEVLAWIDRWTSSRYLTEGGRAELITPILTSSWTYRSNSRRRGVATFLIVNERTKQALPATQLADTDRLLRDLRRITDAGRIRETLELVGLEGHEAEMTRSLSAGWRQRLALGKGCCTVLIATGTSLTGQSTASGQHNWNGIITA